MKAQQVQQLQEKQQQFLQERNWEKLWEVLNQVIDLAPTSENFQNRAKFLLLFQQYEKALIDYKEALALSPGSLEIEEQIQKIQLKAQQTSVKKDFIDETRTDLALPPSPIAKDSFKEEATTSDLAMSPSEVITPSLLIKKDINQAGRLFLKGGKRSFEHFDRYKILGVLGEGGMGKVYHAHDPKLNREVALKIIMGGGQANEDSITRFMQEARAIAQINHPHVIRVYDIGQEEGTNFFTMEYIKGSTLTQIQEKLSYEEKARLLVKIGLAVHEAHEHGIIHRDLKPANVMLDEEGEPRVMDFGLAKVVEEDSGLTKSDAILGTPAYMSPEQAAGELKKIDRCSDIYSLGAIFYELLTGNPPFRGDNMWQIMWQVQEKEPIALRKINPDIPADLEVICLKCLEKEPSKRYQSADLFAQDLQNFIEHKPIMAKPPGVVGKAVKWCYRHPLASSFLFVASFFTFLTLWFLYSRWQTSLELLKAKKIQADQAVTLQKTNKELQRTNQDLEKAKKEKEQALIRSQGELVQAHLHSTQTQIDKRSFLQAGRDARRAFQILEGETSSDIPQQNHYLTEISSLVQYSILPNLPRLEQECTLSLPAITLKLSQRGDQVLVNAYNKLHSWNMKKNIQKLDLSNTTFSLPYNSHFFDLSQNGNLVALVHSKKMMIYSFSQRKRIHLFSLNSFKTIYQVLFSPDQKWVAMRTSFQLFLFNLSENRQYKLPFPLPANRTKLHRIAFSPDSSLLVTTTLTGIEIVSMNNLEEKQKKFPKIPHLAGTIKVLRFSPDGQWLVYGTSKGEVFFYHLSKKSQIVFSAHQAEIRDIRFSPNGRLVASSDDGGRVLLWDFFSRKQFLSLSLPQAVMAVAFDDSGHLFTLERALDQLSYKKWQIEPLHLQNLSITDKTFLALVNKLDQSFSAKAALRKPIVISKSKRFLAIPYAMMISLWDTTTGFHHIIEPTSFLSSREIYALAFSPDDKWLASVDRHNEILIRNTSKIPEVYARIKLPKSIARQAVGYTPDSRFLIFDGGENGLAFYDISQKREILKREGNNWIRSIEVSPDGDWLAFSRSEELHILPTSATQKSAENSTPIRGISRFIGKDPRQGDIHVIAWHPSQKLLATVSYEVDSHNALVSFWQKKLTEEDQWDMVDTIAFREEIHHLNFSPEGNHLAIFLRSQIIIYNLATKQQVSSFIGYFKGGVARLSDDWQHLALPMGTMGVQMWKFPQESGFLEWKKGK